MSLVISYTNRISYSYSYVYRNKNTSYSYSYIYVVSYGSINLVVWGHAACDPGDLMQFDPQVMLFGACCFSECEVTPVCYVHVFP